LISRASLAAKLGYQYGGDRDIYEALGYETDLTYTDFLTQYSRQDIAKAVIDRPVTATWRGGFSLLESDDQDTPLEKDFARLYKRLSLRSQFSRLDRLTGLGKYGILLLGLSDASKPEDFSKPVSGSGHKLLYVKPYGEGNAEVQSYETNPSSERYGQPLLYSVNVSDLASKTFSTLLVHFSRIIHVVEGSLESEVEGTPRLQVVFNRLKDLEKIVGGSAEMFWRGARPGYQGKIDPDYTLTTEMREDLQDQIDEYEHNLRRMLLNEGVSWEALVAQVSDPAGHVDVQIQMISAVTGIPKRILTGSERGELASSEDKSSWFETMEARREEFAEPCIIIPFVDRCILYGILPEAGKEGYSVQWSDLWAASDKEKAEVGRIRSTSLKEYSSMPTAESIVPPDAFLEYFLGLDQRQIEVINEMKEEAMRLEEEEGVTPQLPPQQPSPTPTPPPGPSAPAPTAPAPTAQELETLCPPACGEGGAADPTEVRRLRAKNSYKPATKEKQELAQKVEKKVAKAVGGKALPDNEPFDVLAGKHALEVKTIIGGKNPKITMHPESKARKTTHARKNKLKAWTVAVDHRGSPPTVYVRKGLGSFRLKNMENIGTMDKLAEKIK